MTISNGAAEALTLLTDLIAAAKRAGADAADAVYFSSTGLSASVRLGRPEDMERSESIDFGLRALVGRRQATVSSSDTKPETLKLLVERAVAMAKAYITKALQNAYPIGHGHGPVHHFFRYWQPIRD